jgi:hypothetical protein
MRDIESMIDTDWGIEGEMERLVKTDDDAENKKADIRKEMAMLSGSLSVLKTID